jgi:hypothetical protein
MANDMTTIRPRVSAAEIGAMYGVHAESVRRWTRQGIIPARKVGRAVRYDVVEVDEALRRAADAQWQGAAR